MKTFKYNSQYTCMFLKILPIPTVLTYISKNLLNLQQNLRIYYPMLYLLFLYQKAAVKYLATN